MIVSLSPYNVATRWEDCIQPESHGQIAGIVSFPQLGRVLTQQVGDLYDEGGRLIVTREELTKMAPTTPLCQPSPSRDSKCPLPSPLTTPYRASRRGQRPRGSPMDSYCFQERYNKLTLKNQADLQLAYKIFEGKLPSRKDMREISLQIGIPQSHIKSWFLQHGMEAKTSTSPTATDENLMKRLDEIERRLAALETEVQKSSCLFHSCADSLSPFDSPTCW